LLISVIDQCVVYLLYQLLWWALGNKQVFWFCTIGTLALVAYMVLANGFKIPDIASLQYYKITQWTKFFALLALCKMSSPVWHKLCKPTFKYDWAVGGLAVTLLLCVVGIKPYRILRENTAYEYGWNWKTGNDLLDICHAIDERIPKNALFVQPFTCTELKYWARSSSYVDWKAFVRNRSKVVEWYRRINLVYGVSLNDTLKGFALSKAADDFFYHITPATAQKLKQEGVTHLLTKNKNLPFARMLFCNATYAVYQL
jgi:hypothetical protein